MKQDVTTSSETAILDAITSFYASVGPTTSADAARFTIGKVEKQSFVPVGNRFVKSDGMTRSDGATELQYVTFVKDGVPGYAFLHRVGDEYIVGYFTDNGTISDTIQNKALKHIIDDLPASFYGIPIDIPLNSIFIRPPSPGTETEVIGPITRVQWGQWGPYNSMLDPCDCDLCRINNNGHRPPIGCVTIAVGQCIATIGEFRGETDILFDRYYDVNNIEQTGYAADLATFLREVAIGCNVSFGHSSSPAPVESALQYLREQGHDVFLERQAPDPDKLRVQLASNRPLVVTGSDYDTNKAHMWIIDGLRTTIFADVKRFNYFHCNFGWTGSSDGWYFGLRDKIVHNLGVRSH